MLPDILEPELDIVFCRTAVGAESARRGHYYAHHGNSFWETLSAVRLTPEQLSSDRDRELLRLGIGLTDVAQRKAGMDNEVEAEDFDVEGFTSRIETNAPRVVCFNGKKAAKIVLRRERVEYGVQPERISNSLVFVAPSTSGSARGYWDVRYWHDVAALSRTSE